jgi:hypothetical protein
VENRKAFLVDPNTHHTVLIMCDELNKKEIIPYIMKEGVDQEFKEIRSILKENIRNKEKYCKANVSDKAKNVFEMRFTRNRRNDRIYCKEFSLSKKRVIVMVELFIGKKTQSIPKKIKNRLEAIGGYEYELEY